MHLDLVFKTILHGHLSEYHFALNSNTPATLIFVFDPARIIALDLVLWGCTSLLLQGIDCTHEKRLFKVAQHDDIRAAHKKTDCSAV